MRPLSGHQVLKVELCFEQFRETHITGKHLQSSSVCSKPWSGTGAMGAITQPSRKILPLLNEYKSIFFCFTLFLGKYFICG